MAKKIDSTWIDPEMTTDTELAGEASARSSEDLTFLKLDGSRAMTGNLNLNQNNVANVNKSQKKIVVTSPTYTTTSLNGTLNLNSASSTVHFITGNATGFSVVFPNATTIENGTNFEIYNRSNFAITLKHFDGSTIGILASDSVSSLILQSNATEKGEYSPFTVEVAQAAGIANYNASSSTPFSTTLVNTYQQITDFVVTPVEGKYAIWFNCSASTTTNNSLNYVAIYKGANIVASSERLLQGTASNYKFNLNTLCIEDFDGVTELRVYVKVSTGVLTINERTGVALRLQPVG